jgi:CHASE3 domain sensor protein
MSLNLTFGKKLTASFLSCFVLGSVLGYVAITSIKSLARSIESITVRDARKLKLIGDYQTNVSELRVEQRGVVIAGATHVQTEVDAAHRRFDTEVVHMQQIAEELRPLLVTENGKRLLAETSRAMREWQPLERRIYEASRAGDIELATRLLAESRNIADGMTRDAASLTEAMQALLKTTTDESNAAATRAEVIAYVALAIFLLIGILGIAIVSKSTRQLRRITGQLHESAEQVSSAADQVSSSSQFARARRFGTSRFSGRDICLHRGDQLADKEERGEFEKCRGARRRSRSTRCAIERRARAVGQLHAGHQRLQRKDLPDHEGDQRDCVPNQPAGLECGG